MNKKQLKKAIKEMVRESLLEIFAEMKLETIVENAVNKKRKSSKLQETLSVHERKVPESQMVDEYDIQKRKQMLLEKMGVDKELAHIYDGVEDNPVFSGENGGTEKVSMNALDSLGLARDYSKFIP